MTNNSIVIGGIVAKPPKIIADALEFEKRVFEMRIRRTRISGSKTDEFPVIFRGSAIAELGENIKEGAVIRVIGELRTTTILWEKHIHIYAESIEQAADTQENNIIITGIIAANPQTYKTKSGTTITRLILKVYSGGYRHFIHCAAWKTNAEYAAKLSKGERICVKGYAQSKEHPVKICERDVPVLKTLYEVAVKVIELPDDQKGDINT
jgi:single-stranded DNA-binding protein